MAFSILNFLDKLEPVKGNGKSPYYCPVCSGDRLTVDPKNGKYKCWHGCENKDIREMIAPYSGLSPEYLDRLQEQAKRRREENRKRQEEKRQATLTVDEFISDRDRNLRKWMDSLSLSPEHRANLQKRGFSEEAINQGMYRSLWYGVICPCWIDGKIAGYQVRVDKAEAGNKYKWGKDQRLNNGEMPITVVGEPINSTANLSEGILKPDIAQSKHGGLWVGAAGGHFKASEMTLLRSLRQLGITKIVYWCDSDGTKFNIHEKKAEMLEWLQSQGFEVAIAYWGQLEGSELDCDELPPGTEIKEISIKQYRAKIWFAKHAHPLTRKADSLINFPRLPAQADTFLPREGLVGVASAKKTGKTRAMLKPLITECKQADQSILALFPRISLGLQSCDEWGIPWKDDLDIQTEDGQDLSRMARAHTNAIGVVFDSLLTVAFRDWDVLVLDELHTLLVHLFTSSTHVASIRPQVIAAFERLCRKAKLILCMDADLSDSDIQYMEAITGQKMFLIQNDGRPEEGNPLLFYSGKPGTLRERILSSALDGDRIIYFSDSCSEIDALGMILEQEGIKIQKWTQDTARLPEIKQQMRKPNNWLAENAPQVLLISPTAFVGVSITLECFDLRVGYSVGVLEPSAFRQLIARYRPAIATEIYAQKCGIAGGEFKYFTDPKKIIKAIVKNTKEDFDITALAQAIAAREDFNPGDWIEILEHWKQGDWEDCPSLQMFASIVARRNFARKHNAALLRAELAAEGFVIFDVVGDDAAATKRVKEAKASIREAEASQRFSGWSSDLSLEDALIVLDDPGASLADRNEAKGVILREDLPGFEVTQTWILENIIETPMLSRMRLGYLFQRPELAKLLDGFKMRSHLKQWKSGRIFVPDLGLTSGKLRLLKAIGIEEIISSEGFETNLEDPLISGFWEKCQLRKYQLRRILDVVVSDRSKPGKILSSILQKMGLKLESRIEGKDRKRIYQVAAHPDQVAIFKAWDVKNADLFTPIDGDQVAEIREALDPSPVVHKTLETYAERDIEGVIRSPLENSLLINKATSDHPLTEEQSLNAIALDSRPIQGGYAPRMKVGDRVRLIYNGSPRTGTIMNPAQGNKPAIQLDREGKYDTTPIVQWEQVSGVESREEDIFALWTQIIKLMDLAPQGDPILNSYPQDNSEESVLMDYLNRLELAVF